MSVVLIYLRYIDESIRLIEQYLIAPDDTLLRSLFYQDQRTQDAVLRRLETLSDAAGQLPDDVKARHPEIPWRLITDFRNVLAHAYPDIRLDEVWRVIENDLAPLKEVVMMELERRKG